MEYVLLILGFILLIKGADCFVDGSASVAHKLKVSSMVIGLTVVAMGTSAPECAVSIAASFRGDNAVAISNAIGSNIFNLLIVCGVCSVISPLQVKASTLKKEFPISILAVVAFVGMGYLGMEIGRVDGLLLLAGFLVFLAWLVRGAKKDRDAQEDAEEIKTLSTGMCLVYIVIGLAAIVFGGDIVVDAATKIAENFGLSQTLIGLTIVAMGTSLPELVTSIVAAKKGEADMAIGNVIGSCIFNILLVLGIAGTISPMEVLMENMADAVILIGMSIVTWIFAWSGKRISRTEGAVMVAVYAVYMGYICMR